MPGEQGVERRVDREGAEVRYEAVLVAGGHAMTTLAGRPKPFVVPEYSEGLREVDRILHQGLLRSRHPRSTRRPGLVPIELDLDRVQRMCPLRRCLPRDRAGCGWRVTNGPEPIDGGGPLGAAVFRAVPTPERRPDMAISPCRTQNHSSSKGTKCVGRGRRAWPAAGTFSATRSPVHRGGRGMMARCCPSSDGVSSRPSPRSPTVNMMYGAGRRREAVHDLHELPRVQPDAGGDLLHDRRRGASGLREHHARRAWAGQHRSGAGRHQARLPRPRPRQHPRHRAGPCRHPRRCSTSRCCRSSWPSSTATRWSSSATGTWGR